MLTDSQRERIKDLISDSCGSVGEFVECVPISNGVYEMRYVNLTCGYTGWFWIAAVNKTADGDLNVLELYPSPGPGALAFTARSDQIATGGEYDDDESGDLITPVDRDGLDF
ncbi:hypothetical protein [Tropheryma whipplei]|nr:hypothetical protein [Tropheryma whipplei]MCO8182669.1 hypothetical protein [Tropheryma whipplei]